MQNVKHELCGFAGDKNHSSHVRYLCPYAQGAHTSRLVSHLIHKFIACSGDLSEPWQDGISFFYIYLSHLQFLANPYCILVFVLRHLLNKLIMEFIIIIVYVFS